MSTSSNINQFIKYITRRRFLNNLPFSKQIDLIFQICKNFNYKIKMSILRISDLLQFIEPLTVSPCRSRFFKVGGYQARR